MKKQPKRHFPGGLGQVDWDNPQDESIPTGRRETVLLMHPEVAGMYTHGFDNDSQTLEGSPRRCDTTYVSAERLRLRSKYGG